PCVYLRYRLFFLSFLLLLPPPPTSTLFPYTTLFRSSRVFLFAFLPVAYFVFWKLSSKQLRYIWLTISGYVFYSFWNYKFCGIMADRKSTRLNSSHVKISYAVFCLKKKKKK